MAQVIKLTVEELTVRELEEETGIKKSRVNRIQAKAWGATKLGTPVHPAQNRSLDND
jgi:hypothetical protein